MDFKQWLHETKQQVEEAKWREKSLSEDLASSARREQDLQTSVAEMDATIMGLEEVITVHADMRACRCSDPSQRCLNVFVENARIKEDVFSCIKSRCCPTGKQQPEFYG